MLKTILCRVFLEYQCFRLVDVHYARCPLYRIAYYIERVNVNVVYHRFIVVVRSAVTSPDSSRVYGPSAPNTMLQINIIPQPVTFN